MLVGYSKPLDATEIIAYTEHGEQKAKSVLIWTLCRPNLKVSWKCIQKISSWIICQVNAGVCRIKVHLHGSQSLKEKRSVIKSMISRIRSQFNVSIAEVDDQELWQLATLGVACISNHDHHVGEVLSKVVNFVKQNYPQLEIVEHVVEILDGP